MEKEYWGAMQTGKRAIPATEKCKYPVQRKSLSTTRLVG